MTLGQFQRLCDDYVLRHGRPPRFAWLTAKDRRALVAWLLRPTPTSKPVAPIECALDGSPLVLDVAVRVAPPWLQAPYLCFSDLIAERIDEATATGNFERAQNFAIANGEPEIETVGHKLDDGSMIATYPTIDRRGPAFHFWQATRPPIPAEELEQEIQRAVEEVERRDEQAQREALAAEVDIRTMQAIYEWRFSRPSQEAGLADLVTYYAAGADARHRARERCGAPFDSPPEDHADHCTYRALLLADLRAEA